MLLWVKKEEQGEQDSVEFSLRICRFRRLRDTVIYISHYGSVGHRQAHRTYTPKSRPGLEGSTPSASALAFISQVLHGGFLLENTPEAVLLLRVILKSRSAGSDIAVGLDSKRSRNMPTR
jgi:hypothetical protein